MKSVFRPQYERKTSNGWDERYLSFGLILIAWAALAPGEPWEGAWIGFRAARSSAGRFVRFGLRPFGAFAIGVAK